MHRDRDFDPNAPLPPNTDDLVQDLELGTLYDAMAGGDEFLRAVAQRAVVAGLTDPEEVLYRQDVLRDCLDHPEVVRAIYDIPVEVIRREKKIFGSFLRSPDTVLRRALDLMGLFQGELRRLRTLAEDNAPDFRSEGFTRLFAMLGRELDDKFLQTMDDHLRQLRFNGGVLVSARLGKGNKGVQYVLREVHKQRPGWWEALTGSERSGYTVHIAERDEAGAHALMELRGRGVEIVAGAMSRSAEHVLGFFRMLRTELAFYIGCLNLHERLARKGEPTCLPCPLPTDEGRELGFRGLYDTCLALLVPDRVVGSDMKASGKPLVVVTGANQGGKSTFLRSLGLAQLMMQCGMFVSAQFFSADVACGVFTHFRREEDAGMRSGKLDEELRRMSGIVDHLLPGAVLLCNESFAATNEREGSEIARQVVHALLARGVAVVFVTHFYDLAESLYEEGLPAMFLRPERTQNGRRTFRIIEGEPLPTSFGEDIYKRVFADDTSDVAS